MPEPSQSKACYNCRRRRLRCDRSRPSCRKCYVAGEACLGYGTVLRWANAPAIRGKLAGHLPQEPQPWKGAPRSLSSGANDGPVLISSSLLDPLLVDLDRRARYYLHHCK